MGDFTPASGRDCSKLAHRDGPQSRPHRKSPWSGGAPARSLESAGAWRSRAHMISRRSPRSSRRVFRNVGKTRGPRPLFSDPAPGTVSAQGVVLLRTPVEAAEASRSGSQSRRSDAELDHHRVGAGGRARSRAHVRARYAKERCSNSCISRIRNRSWYASVGARARPHERRSQGRRAGVSTTEVRNSRLVDGYANHDH